MLKKLRQLFGGDTASSASDTDSATSEHEPMHQAVACLLVEAACADNQYDEQEKAVIDEALQEQFGFDAEAAKTCREAAETVQSSSNDLHRFTKIAKQMPEDEKASFLENMWAVILSDAHRDPYEETLMRRLCGLLHVSDRTSGEARQRAAARKSG